MIRAGVITGRVSTSDGQVPTGFAHVGVLAGDPHVGTGIGAVVGADGRYTIDFLGPYDWPLLFEARGQASQWSGHVGNRHLARTVKVNADAIATYDFRFRQAVTVTVKVNGLPSDEGTIDVVNALTGDFMGDGCCGSEMAMPLAGPQLVKFIVWAGGEVRWVGGDDFLDAQAFWIPSSGSKTITVDF